jgi:hypothetical protein
MKLLFALTFLFVAAISQGSDFGITDGNSLQEGLKSFKKAQAGATLTSQEQYRIGVSL